MLETAIEIEGLLRIIRDGDPLPETYILLNKKATQLAEQVSSIGEKADRPKPQPGHADFVMASPASREAVAPQVVFAIHETAPKEEPAILQPETAIKGTAEEGDFDHEDLALIEEDDIILSFDDLPEQEAATVQAETPEAIAIEGSFDISIEDQRPEEEPIPLEEPVDEPLPQPKPEPEDEPGDKAAAEQAEAQKTQKDTAPPLEPETPSQPTPMKRNVKLKSAFSLNDRFLYSRELFDGNMKMFDSTLDFIEGIEEYSIIEDYFYSELEWDPENSHVAAFMDILRPHFKE